MDLTSKPSPVTYISRGFFHGEEMYGTPCVILGNRWTNE